MNPTTVPVFTPASTIGEIVVLRPELARVFESLQIDYCCGGRQSVAQAAAGRDLSAGDVLARLEAALAVPWPGAKEVDAAALGLAALADHIEETHHAYLKEELPRLVELAGRVAQHHGERDARLREVARLTAELAEEMTCHMQKEELILFPLVRQIAAGRGLGSPVGLLEAPIDQMEDEHRAAGDAIARLSLLTDGFDGGASFCNTHRALLEGLARFQRDLHQHVHKENNVLFPRALREAAAAGARFA